MRNARPPCGMSAIKFSCRGVAAWVLLLCAISPPVALARHQHVDEQQAASWRAAQAAQGPQAPVTREPGFIKIGNGRFQIPDIELLDQDGRQVRLYSDLIKGRVVVVSFFFTTCTFVCPAQGRALARLQERLGGRLGREVFFVSISKDPKTDKADNLKRWGEELGVGPGWRLVTGEESVMRKLLWDFIGEHPGPRLHDPVVFIGNDRTGLWTAAGGLSAPERLVRIIDQLAGPVAPAER